MHSLRRVFKTVLLFVHRDEVAVVRGLVGAAIMPTPRVVLVRLVGAVELGVGAAV